MGALGFTCYYLGQVVAAARHRPQPLPVGWQPPTWAWRQSTSGEVVTSVSQLQIGAQVLVGTICETVTRAPSLNALR